MENHSLTLALLDGDIIAYQAVSVATKDIDWGDGTGRQPHVDLQEAIDTACSLIEEQTKAVNFGVSKARPVVCFSSRIGTNFRKHLCPTYKAGRGDKPPHYWEVVDAIEARFKFFRLDGLEADDVMGIAGTDTQRFGETVIVSLDKDLQTIPGWYFRPGHDIRPRRISVAQADYFWLTQALTGDPVDGFKGCPKIGPVNAKRILDPHTPHLGAMWSAVVETYEAADLPSEHALLQARLARILRSCDYDRETKEIKLWHLTKPESLALSALTAPQPGDAPDAPSTTPASESVPEPKAKRSSAKPTRRKK